MTTLKVLYVIVIIGLSSIYCDSTKGKLIGSHIVSQLICICTKGRAYYNIVF